MNMFQEMAASHPKLNRGMVWCKECGNRESVKSSDALQNGWPKCCGYTMTIDSPEERNEQQSDDNYAVRVKAVQS